MSCALMGRTRSTRVRTPRSSLATVNRSVLGSTLTTSSAFATSIPTNMRKLSAEGSRVTRSCENSGSTDGRPPQLFGLYDEGITTPLTLTHGVHHPDSFELAPRSECLQTL